MASKYDFYWRNRLKEISTLLDKAYHGDKGCSLDVSGIKSLGDRGNWRGVVDVCNDKVGKGDMVHAKSLGNVIVDNKLLKDYGDSHFTLTISSDCILTAIKTSRGRSIQSRPIASNNRQVSSADNKIVCFIPCCKSKNATDLYRKIKDPVTVKNALGHSSITTTMIYVHLVGADVEKALSGING